MAPSIRRFALPSFDCAQERYAAWRLLRAGNYSGCALPDLVGAVSSARPGGDLRCDEAADGLQAEGDVEGSIGPSNPKTREERLKGRVLLFTYSYGP